MSDGNEFGDEITINGVVHVTWKPLNRAGNGETLCGLAFNREDVSRYKGTRECQCQPPDPRGCFPPEPDREG